MARRSAGLLVFQRGLSGEVKVLLVHPGGPFWHGRDKGAWSIPKGEYGEREDALQCAVREFEEEIGRPPPEGDLIPLGEVQQRGGKRVACWAISGDVDTQSVSSNTATVEWPRRSGRYIDVPEIDRAEWFPTKEARWRLIGAQQAFLDRLLEAVASCDG